VNRRAGNAGNGREREGTLRPQPANGRAGAGRSVWWRDWGRRVHLKQRERSTWRKRTVVLEATGG